MKKSFVSGIALVSLIAWGSSACFAETVRIIAEDDWYPYSAKFAEGPKGIAEDLVRAAFAAEGVQAQFDVMNYDHGMDLVKNGGAIGCFDAPRTKEVEDVYLWHEERLFSADSYFYVASDFAGKINGLADVAGKKVGLTQGYGYGNTIDLDKTMVKEYSKTDTILVRKLMARRLDSIVLFDKVADYLLPKLSVKGKLRSAGKADSTDIYVAFSKKHPDGKKYCDLFSQGFRKIKSNGAYQKIMISWDARLKSTTPEKMTAE